MEAPDIASLLHDITPINYHPKWLLWLVTWSLYGYLALAGVLLCVIMLIVWLIRYYMRSDVRALRELRRLERLCERGLNTNFLLDRLVAIMRAYLSDVCNVQTMVVAEEGLSHFVRELSLSADEQKQAEYIFRILIRYRFAHIQHSPKQVWELIAATRSFVQSVGPSS